MPEPAHPTYPVTVIAKLLMMTERRVQQLTKEGVIPRQDRGRYELAPTVQAYIRYLQDRIAGRTEDGSNDWSAARAKHMAMKAELAEIELKKARAEVIAADEVKRAWAAILGEVRAALLGTTPVRIAQLVQGVTDSTELKRIVKTEIEDAMRAISKADIEKILRDQVVKDPDDDL
jgi:phage terminase Nu1 subunit (DNA packaging protein)